MLYLIWIFKVQHLLRILIGSIFIQSNACFLKTCLILLSSNMVFVENFELDFPGLLRENFQDCSRSKISNKNDYFFEKLGIIAMYQPFPIFLYFIFGFCIDSGLFILFIRVQRIASKPKKSVSSLDRGRFDSQRHLHRRSLTPMVSDLVIILDLNLRLSNVLQ